MYHNFFVGEAAWLPNTLNMDQKGNDVFNKKPISEGVAQFQVLLPVVAPVSVGITDEGLSLIHIILYLGLC